MTKRKRTASRRPGEARPGRKSTGRPQRAARPQAAPQSPPVADAALVDLAEHGGPGPDVPTIVGVGASAGGLEAFSQLLEALPSNANVAIIFVQHLSPQHESA